MVKKKTTTSKGSDVQENKPETPKVSESASRKLIKGHAHISASYNNTVLTITDESGNVIVWSTAGSLGFKGAKKATPYAATKIVETALEKMKKVGLSEVSVFVRGIGGGREAAIRALANKGLNIASIKDVTPLPHNGCKPPKVRRI